MKKLLFVALLLFILGCSEPLKITPYTYTQVFTGETSKGFYLRSIHFLQEGRAPIAFNLSDPNSFPPCIMDDIYEFHNTPERKFVIREGPTKCDASDPDVFLEDTWTFVNNTATLTFPFPLLGGTVPFIVREADDRGLTVEIYFDDNKQGYRFTFRPVSGG